MSKSIEDFRERLLEVANDEHKMLLTSQMAHLACNACRVTNPYNEEEISRVNEATGKLLIAKAVSPEEALDKFCSPEILPIANSLDLSMIDTRESSNMLLGDEEMQERLIGAFKHDNIGCKGEIFPRYSDESNIRINIRQNEDNPDIYLTTRKRNLITHIIGKTAVTLGKRSTFLLDNDILSDTVFYNKSTNTSGGVPNYPYPLNWFQVKRLDKILHGKFESTPDKVKTNQEIYRQKMAGIATVYYVDTKELDE